MSLTIRDVNHAVELSFSGDLNIYNIASIKEQVQKALEFDPTNTAIQKNIQILQQRSPAPAPRSSTNTKKPASTGK